MAFRVASWSADSSSTTRHLEKYSGYESSIALRKINSLVAALDSGKIINDQLEIMDKSGFRRIYWCFLKLVSPFYRLFGSDAFSHVRVHRVADKILQYCNNETGSMVADRTYKSGSPRYRPIVPKALVAVKDRLIPKLKRKIRNKNALLTLENKINQAVGIYQQRTCSINPSVNLITLLNAKRHISAADKREILRVIDCFSNSDEAKLLMEDGSTKVKFYNKCPWSLETSITSTQIVNCSLFSLRGLRDIEPIALSVEKLTQAINRLDDRSHKGEQINELRGDQNLRRRDLGRLERLNLPANQKREIRRVLNNFSECDFAKFYSEPDGTKIKFFRKCPWTQRNVKLSQMDVTRSDFFNIGDNLPDQGVELNLAKINRGIELSQARHERTLNFRNQIRDRESFRHQNERTRTILSNSFYYSDRARLFNAPPHSTLRLSYDCPWTNDVRMEEVDVTGLNFFTPKVALPPEGVEVNINNVERVLDHIESRRRKAAVARPSVEKLFEIKGIDDERTRRVLYNSFCDSDTAWLFKGEGQTTIRLYNDCPWTQNKLIEEVDVTDLSIFDVYHALSPGRFWR